MTIDIAKSFTFMFEDPDWLPKLGIGTLIVLIGLVLSAALVGVVPLIIAAGYSLEVTANVMNNQAFPLPDWHDWGRFLGRGIKLVVVFVVWLLPLIIPLILGAFGGALGNSHSGAVSFVGGLVLTCSVCLSVLWGLVVLLFEPAIYARLAATDRISSGFEFVKLWEFTRANLTNVIVAIIMTIAAGIISLVVALAGTIAIVIGLLVTVPLAILWKWLVQAHLFGQVGAPGVAPANQATI
jgi:hypothetical protein